MVVTTSLSIGVNVTDVKWVVIWKFLIIESLVDL